MVNCQLSMVMFSFCFYHLSFLVLRGSSTKPDVRVVLLYPLSSCDQLITEVPFNSAFDEAATAINSSQDFSFTMSIESHDTRCSELVGIKAMTQQWNSGVHAFIGPGNDSFCATSARIAASWNLPLISYVSACRFVLSQGNKELILPQR